MAAGNRSRTKMTKTPTECTRCGKPILSDGQTCAFEGQRWPCVRSDDPTVINVPVGGVTLRIKTGGRMGAVSMPADPYE